MRASRGWRGLYFFWVGVVASCCLGAATLQVLGPPAPKEGSAPPPALDRLSVKPADLTSVATASGDADFDATARIPNEPAEKPSPPVATAPPAVVALSDHVAASDLPPDSASPVATEPPETQATRPAPTPAVAMTEPSDDTTASGGSNAAIAAVPPAGPVPDAPPDTAAAAATVRLRISRDFEHCPTTACYRWQKLSQGPKLPRDAIIDLAQLHFAPGQREAAESGQVELIVDALQRRERINGRDSLTLVATNLAGVTPMKSAP